MSFAQKPVCLLLGLLGRMTGRKIDDVQNGAVVTRRIAELLTQAAFRIVAVAELKQSPVRQRDFEQVDA